MKRIKKIMAVAVGAVLLGATLTGCVVGKDKYEAKAQELQTVQDQLKEAQADTTFLTTELGTAEQKLNDSTTLISQYELELDEKDRELLAYEQSTAAAEDLEENTHLIDEIALGGLVNELVTDRELAGLTDSKVDFDDEDYDVEEFLQLDGVEIATNEEDFGSNTYLSFPESSIVYAVEFEDTLNTTEINDDETLTFAFLGKEVEVTDWDGDEITFTSGEEHTLADGESIVVDGKTVTLVATGSDYAYFTVNGEGKKISEDNTRDIGGVEIKVKEVLEAESWRVGRATFEIGNEVEFVVEDGDEYAEDSIWEYVITPSTIGLQLSEEHTDIDDVEYNALSSGDKVCLPNEYLCVQYNGLVEEESNTYKVDFDTINLVQYVRLRGNFVSGLNDFDRVYLNGTDFLDEDLDFIANSEMGLGDSDLFLTTNGTSLFFDSLELPVGLNALFDGMNDISGRDEDYLSNYGIVVNVPEDAVEENEFEFSVPEEQVEATISVIRK